MLLHTTCDKINTYIVAWISAEISNELHNSQERKIYLKKSERQEKDHFCM